MKTTRPTLPVPASQFTTSRLLLRPMNPNDLDDLYILRTQIEVMKWTSTTKIDVNREATRIWMKRFLPPNDSSTYNFCVEELSFPGNVIGVIGLHLVEPPEVGYMLRKEVWGKGYATEGLKGWLRTYWDLPRKEIELSESVEHHSRDSMDHVSEHLQAEIESHNIHSQRVLEKCGFERVSSREIEENGGMVTLVKYHAKRPDR